MHNVREDEQLTVVARAPVSVAAPVVPGQVIGQVCAYLDGEEVAAVNMIAAAPSAKREVPVLFFVPLRDAKR